MGLHRVLPVRAVPRLLPAGRRRRTPTVHVGTVRRRLRRARRALAATALREGRRPRPDERVRPPAGDAGTTSGARGRPARDSSVTLPDDVAVDLHLLAAAVHDTRTSRARAWSMRPILAGRSLRTPDALQHDLAEQLRPAGDARRGCRSPRRPASRRRARASGSSVMPPGSLPQLPMSRLRSRVVRQGWSSSRTCTRGAAAVQVPHAGDEVGDPADPRLELLVGVGDHRGVEARGRR